ncbi:MAG: hypothetical protein QOK42_1835 [Frankiaceae bacterium]|nr:hypothetical protein [Frankiaceae bacterium]MDX6225782.1 hypothetical protein [Frankiales bacterium]MDX6274965.1 hypothetical protein [Frankiales bacterium]
MTHTGDPATNARDAAERGAALDAALDRSRRDREAAAALQAAVEEQLRRSASTTWPRLAATRGRQA